MDCLEEVGGKLVRKLVVFAHNESRLKIYNSLLRESICSTSDTAFRIILFSVHERRHYTLVLAS